MRQHVPVMTEYHSKVVVIGVGNPIASDDGVGIRSVMEFQRTLHDERVTCVECERGGLDLLDLLKGFDGAVIIDAAKTGNCSPGGIATFVIRQPFALTAHRSLHTMELDSVLAFGSLMGMQLPDEVSVVAVEAADIETFHEGCTPEVQSAIPHVVNRVQNEIVKILPDLQTSPHSNEEISV